LARGDELLLMEHPSEPDRAIRMLVREVRVDVAVLDSLARHRDAHERLGLGDIGQVVAYPSAPRSHRYAAADAVLDGAAHLLERDGTLGHDAAVAASTDEGVLPRAREHLEAGAVGRDDGRDRVAARVHLDAHRGERGEGDQTPTMAGHGGH